MAAFCINTHSQEFKDTAKRLGVSQFELEQIAYKYGNQEGTFGQFPSDDYIKEQLNGVPNYNATEAQAELWKLRYSTPREFDTLEELNAAKKDALQYFEDESVHSFVNADGKYELRVAEQDNEYQRIKEQAIANGTFMMAPNGNQSNLTEQQWIQVRSKAFKDWFGDWENDPSNASKVVDENGEPLVVYHGSDNYGFDTFSKSDDGKSYFFSNRKSVAESYISDFEVGLLGTPLFNQIKTDVEYDITGDRTGEFLTVQRLKEELKKLYDSKIISQNTYNRAIEDANKLKDGSVAYYSDDTIFRSEQQRKVAIERAKEKYKDVKTEDLPNYNDELVIFGFWERDDFIKDLAETPAVEPDYAQMIDVDSYRRSKPNMVYPVFLNIRKPKVVSAYGANWDSISYYDSNGELKRSNTRGLHSISLNEGNDGTIINNVVDFGGWEPTTDDFTPQYAGDHYTSEDFWKAKSTLYVASQSNQIKSATENRGTFFENDPGIYNQESSDTGNITGLPDQMSANEAFQMLSKQYAPDSSEAKLSKLVFDALQKTGITFRAANLPMGVRGKFSASDNAILFSKDGILNNTLLHEAIHAVSVYYMKAANREGFSDEIKIAIKEIEECYDLLKEYLLDKETKSGGNREAIFGFLTSGFGRYYGMSSATELVAEITNPDIVSLIKEFDSVHKGKNIFQKLIDAIAKFFGITKKYGSLEKTLKDALVTLIENPNAELMQRYALENNTLKSNYHMLDSAEKAIIFGAKKQASEAFENAEFNSAGEYDTTLVVPLDSVVSGYVYQKVPGAHNELTQSPIGAIFKMYNGDGFGTFLLNGTVVVSEDNNTVSIPASAAFHILP